jgi:hypothetical protein
MTGCPGDRIMFQDNTYSAQIQALAQLSMYVGFFFSGLHIDSKQIL